METSKLRLEHLKVMTTFAQFHRLMCLHMYFDFVDGYCLSDLPVPKTSRLGQNGTGIKRRGMKIFGALVTAVLCELGDNWEERIIC